MGRVFSLRSQRETENQRVVLETLSRTQMLRAGRTREEMSFRQQRDCVSPLFSFMEVNTKSNEAVPGTFLQMVRKAEFSNKLLFFHQKHSLGELHQETFFYLHLPMCSSASKGYYMVGHPHPAEPPCGTRTLGGATRDA